MRFKPKPPPPAGEIELPYAMEWALDLHYRPEGISSVTFQFEGGSFVPRIGETITLRVIKIVREDVET